MLSANITDGLENIFTHAVVIYALENDQYKVKDSRGQKYEIPKNRCTFMQVKRCTSILKWHFTMILTFSILP